MAEAAARRQVWRLGYAAAPLRLPPAGGLRVSDEPITLKSVTGTQRFARPVASLLAASIVAGGVLSVAAAPGHAAANVAAAKAAFREAPLPASLKAAESSAEDIVDFALSGDHGQVVASAASLKAAANGPAAAALTRSGVPPAKVAQLKQRANRVARLARGGSFIDIALGANAVSQLMPDLYGRFQDPVPAPILTLDYLDREAQLRSLARQPEKVALAVKELAPTWARIRPKVIAAGGAKEAAAYQKHVATMKRLEPNAGRKAQAEAVHGLDLVDQLEHVFAR